MFLGTGNQLLFEEEGIVISSKIKKRSVVKFQKKKRHVYIKYEAYYWITFDLLTIEDFLKSRLALASKDFTLEFQKSQ